MKQRPISSDATALRQLPAAPTYFRITLRELGTTAKRRAALLDGTGVTEAQLDDPSTEITLGQQLRQFQNAARIARPGWSIDVGKRFDLGAQGPLGFAMITAPTLGRAFDVMARYGHVRSPWFSLTTRRDGAHWTIVVQRRIRLGAEHDVTLAEALMLSAQSLIEAVLGRPMRDARLAFDYQAPAWSDRYRTAFSCPLSFGAELPSIRTPIAWRAMACPLADAGLHDLLINRMERDRRRLESGEHLEARVEALFEAAGDAGLSLSELAARMHLSPRTLNRRLTDAGTSFGDMRDRHGKRRADALLADHAFPVSEIAYRLGYSDPANFVRAFRRWHGRTPSEHRARLNRR
jgi:AraC-like DNA-binding protein